MMKYLLYCVIRRPSLVNQAFYSMSAVLTVSNIADYKIVVLTDMAENMKKERKKLSAEVQKRIIIEKISANTVNEWIGSDNYIFRVKIKAIQYFFEKYKENVFLIDCDMYPKRDISNLLDQIQSDKFIMYSQYKDTVEQYLQDQDMNLLNDEDKNIIHNKEVYISDDKCEYKIELSRHPYLSCVIGIKYENRYLVDKILEICDLIYKKLHLYTSEELAVMFVFENFGKIVEADSYFNTTRAEEWLCLLFGYSCGVFADGDEQKYMNLVKNISLKIFHNTTNTYSFDYLRLLASAYLAWQKSNKIPSLPAIIATGVEFSFIKNDRTDYTLIQNLYEKYIGG